MSSIPSIRIHKASQQAYVRVNGRDRYLGPAGTAAVFEKYAQVLHELAPACDRPRRGSRSLRSVSVAELAHRYLASIIEKVGRSHKLAYESKYVAAALIRQHGSHRVDEFGPLAMRRVRDRLRADGKSRPWVNRLLAGIRRCFKWGVAEELVTADRLAALKAVDGLRAGEAPDAPPRMAASPAAVEACLRHLEGMGDAGAVRLIRFLRATGCRPCEACSASWGEFGLDSDPPTFRPRHHKTARLGIERVVPLNRDAVQAVRPGLVLPRDGDPVFVNTKGRPFTPNSLLLAIRRAIRATGCADWSPYGLRHLAATRALAATGCEAAAAALLGHTPRSTIIQRYSRDRLELATRAARALEGAA